jgi:hypothetical protein
MMQLNPTVGVAPGTTTMTLGDHATDYSDCPPDEAWQYVNPPQVTTGLAPGVSSNVTQGPTPEYWDPYQDLPSLKGARGLGSFTDDLSNANWGMIVFAGALVFGVAFVSMYGRDWFKRRRA